MALAHPGVFIWVIPLPVLALPRTEPGGGSRVNHNYSAKLVCGRLEWGLAQPCL